MILSRRGYGPLWALFVSVSIYAGAMEYAALDMLVSPFAPLTAALTALAVNARHLFCGISMVDRYRGMKPKAFLIHTLTDETCVLLRGVNVDSHINVDLDVSKLI